MAYSSLKHHHVQNQTSSTENTPVFISFASFQEPKLKTMLESSQSLLILAQKITQPTHHVSS